MSEKDTNRQEKFMTRFFKGKQILKPMDTGWIDSQTACLREYAANIFFYTKNGITIMIDAGCSYDRLEKKMKWLNLGPDDVRHILLTHLDEDRAGALKKGEPYFDNAKIYVGSLENQYLTGLVQRKIFNGLYKLPKPEIKKQPSLLKDGMVLNLDGIRVEAILVPGHTWGHMVYLVDDRYLFTGDTIWLGPDGGYSYLNVLAEDNKLACQSLAGLKENIFNREIKPVVITAHSGWTAETSFAFAHVDQFCNAWKKQQIQDPEAPIDGYDESPDIEKKARTVKLAQRKQILK